MRGEIGVDCDTLSQVNIVINFRDESRAPVVHAGASDVSVSGKGSYLNIQIGEGRRFIYPMDVVFDVEVIE